MATKIKVLRNCGIGGENVEAGVEMVWDEAVHGDTLGSFVEAGLVEVAQAPAEAPADVAPADVPVEAPAEGPKSKKGK